MNRLQKVTTYVLLLWVCLGWNIFLHAQDNQYRVKLQTVDFVPRQGINESFKSVLQADLNNGLKRHVIVQFQSNPTKETRLLIQTQGLKLLQSLGGNAWFAVIEDEKIFEFTDDRNFRRKPYLSQIRGIDEIRPEFKLSEAVSKNQIGAHARPEPGKVILVVQCFSDVSRETAREAVAKYGAILEGPGMLNDWLVTIDSSRINELAREETVQFVDQKSYPETTHNDCSRAAANVNVVQGGVYNLNGTNVQIGVWDGGEIGNHTDFGARVTIVEAVGVSDHATHVTGTMAGDGASSPGNQFRGVATNANMFSLTFLLTDLEPEEHEDQINDNGIDLSQNSWGVSAGFGNYDLRASKFDNVITGTYGRQIPIVFSAGNSQGSTATGFNTITPPGGTGKNVITVGAINCDDNTMTTFSSWGPTDDGRVKPDVVAPGDESGAAGVISTISQNFDDDNFNNATGASVGDGIDDFFFPYVTSNAGAGEPEAAGTAPAPQNIWRGTSMAAPVVSGTVALMLQQYRRTYYGSDASNQYPLPSTFKSILTHTATDLGNAGPDYRFGYGLINAQAAVDVIRSGRVLQNVIAQAEEQVYAFTVPAGTANLRVTMAWDDPPAAALAATTLINNIDLSLEAPDGTVFNPWVLNPATPAVAATTGVDNVNNVEQVFVNAPQAGNWRIHINGTDLDEPVGDPRQAYSLVSDFPFVQLSNVSVTQVLDRTGSMGFYSYMAPAIAAAQNFIALMQTGDEVGVVHFADLGCDDVGAKASSPFNLVEITSELVKTNAATAVNTTASGCTSIGAGMQEGIGANQLGSAASDNPHAMVLLTDGFENTSPTTATVLPTVPDGTRIYTIAMGETADETLMQNIATTTGGQYYNSPSIFNLMGIYYQIQGEVEDAAMASLAQGTKSGGNDTYVVPLEEGLEEVVFVIGWLENQAILALRIVDPNGNTVASGGHVSGGVPASLHRLIKPAPGKWEVHITRTDRSGITANYTFAALIKGGSDFYSFTPTILEAGECLLTKVHLVERTTNAPITGATVKAIFSAPKVSNYTLNHQYAQAASKKNNGIGPWLNQFPQVLRYYPKGNYTAASTKRDGKVVITPGSTTGSTIASDPLPGWAANLRAENAKSQTSIFQYDEWEVTLFDDGTHGDEEANDGNYTNCADRSKIAGSYNVRFKIEGVTGNGNTFNRQRLASTTVAPSFSDPSLSAVSIFPKRIQSTGTQGTSGVITIVPTDRHGNLLGPGFASAIKISSTAGTLQGSLIDNGDGYYLQQIASNGKKETGRLQITVENVPLNNTPQVMFRNLKSGFTGSLHVGIANPLDSLADVYNSGFYGGVDVGYQINPTLSVVGYFEYNSFGVKNDNSTDKNFSIYNISLNAKAYRAFAYPFGVSVQAGGGFYFPEGSDAAFGYNIGANLDYSISSLLKIEAGVDFNKMKDGSFLQAGAGLIFKF